jgi:hypothetical protein
VDADIRRLEKLAASGDYEAVARLRQAQRRVGALPVAGEYVRLNGALIEHPHATGNWRVMAMIVGCDLHVAGTDVDAAAEVIPGVASSEMGSAPGTTVTLSPVRPNRELVSCDSRQLLTLTFDELARARVECDAPIQAEPLRAVCPRCDAGPGTNCATPSGDERRTPHVGRGRVGPLQPPPPPLPVSVSAPRQRPSKVRVIESRNRNADLRITAANLAERRDASTGA